MEKYDKDKSQVILFRKTSSKSSLNYLYIENNYNQVKIHSIYQIIKSSQLAIRKACIEAKVICGVYMLQSHKVRFNQSDSTVCPLCRTGNEEVTHFILNCNHSAEIEFYKKKFFDCIDSAILRKNIMTEDEEKLVRFILNTALGIEYGLSRKEILKLERMSRDWLFKQHKTRAKKLEYSKSKGNCYRRTEDLDLSGVLVERIYRNKIYLTIYIFISALHQRWFP